jgi:hypothetical protein
MMEHVLKGEGVVVMTWDDSDPPPPEVLMSRPGQVAVLIFVSHEDASAIFDDPQLQFWCDLNTPVMLDFERVADAETFQRRVRASHH